MTSTVVRKEGAMCTGLIFISLLTFALSGYIPPGPHYACPAKQQLLHPCRCTAGSDQGLYVTCDNTNLASLAVGLANIASLHAPVEHLKITTSRIARLYGDLFYPLDVRVLFIEDVPLRSIEAFTFLGVNRTLQELHVVRSRLEQFPTDAFQVLGNLSVLMLDTHNISSVPADALSSGLLPSRLERFSLINGNLSSWLTDTLASCRKLKRLDLHGNQITSLVKNQFKGLRDVEFVDLSFNQITKIDASNLGDLNKMSWCNLSHNAIQEITRGAFARNTVLRSLNLAHNQLTRLDANSFRGMRFIRRLYLSDNAITDIGRGTFGSVSRIGTIDLARNRIRRIDFQMFYQLQYVEIIDVSENLVTEIQKLAFKDLYLVDINLSHNAIAKIEARAFENCANITRLDLSYNRLTDIPSKAFDDITYATELQLSYNNLTDLSQVPLGNMTGLKVLNVTHNQISVIPRNTFPKLYELHTIDLSHNVLSDIASGVFQTLFGLRSLNLSYNSLREIKSSTLGTLPTLLEMNLSYNELSDVSRGALLKLSSLRTLNARYNSITSIFQPSLSLADLDLSYNNISAVDKSAWPSMNSLLTLNLRNNLLYDNLQGGSFSNLLTLRILDLSENGISQAPWESLRDLTSLQYLYLEGNQLSELGKGAFGRLPVVFELNLARNQLSNISERAFDGLLQLITLNLSSNSLAHIPMAAFQGLVSMRSLDLSYNSLESLDNKTNGLFDDCLSLETLNLSHNRISFVTRKSFPSSPWIPYKLRELDLSFNSMPALTYDITFGTSRLHYLNLSHNSINEIRRGVIGNLSSLVTLDLSHNQLADLTEENTFSPGANLSHLSLSHNSLFALPMQRLTHLSELDLRDNKLDLYMEAVAMVTNGSRVFYEGNTITCDCHVRPLRRWLLRQRTLPPHWLAVTCHRPSLVEGVPLLKVAEEALECESGLNTNRWDLGLTPDVQIREQHRTPKGEFAFTWFVNTVEDIADFMIIVREPGNGSGSATVYNRSVPYNTRTFVLRYTQQTQSGLQLCLMGLNSEGVLRRPSGAQCQFLPSGALPVVAYHTTLFYSQLALIVAALHCWISQALLL